MTLTVNIRLCSMVINFYTKASDLRLELSRYGPYVNRTPRRERFNFGGKLFGQVGQLTGEVFGRNCGMARRQFVVERTQLLVGC